VGEKTPFDGFKFGLGDVVRHGSLEMNFVVTDRLLSETLGRAYSICRISTFGDDETDWDVFHSCREFELALVNKRSE
jgi:hypothetical protein